jgi:diguanylate cyclase
VSIPLLSRPARPPQTSSLRDPLTGLPNRQALTDRIVELDPRAGSRVVLTLDLNGFRQVNDVLGPEAGDRLLVSVAATLREHSPAEALIARIGGDEFAVLCPGDLARGRALAGRLRSAVVRVLDRAAPGIWVSASVGVGQLPDQPSGAAPDPRHRLGGLVESAAALRVAKEAGPGCEAVQVYAGEMARARERRLRVEHRLRPAIAEGAIVTHGQPIVDLATGRLTGFEALARWDDEELGPVTPDEFIAVAEQTGLVVALGEHLLDHALAGAVEAGVFAAGLTLSVNASPIQLRVPGFAATVADRVARLGIPAGRLVVEITEAVGLTGTDAALHTLADLHAAGVGLAIDDFGSGYSALGYLHRLPVQVVKIDKSLTVGLPGEPRTVAVVDGVVRMAHRMGVSVVMEGVEDEPGAGGCRAVGADRGQGNHFGRPAPWAELGARGSGGQPIQGEAPAVVVDDHGAQAGAGRGSSIGAQRPPSSS